MAAPILLIPLYLYLSDAWPQWRQFADVVALIVAVAIGLAGVWLLSAPRSLRVVVFPVYTIGITFVSALWAIAYRGGF